MPPSARTVGRTGEWLYAICELPTPVARPWLQPSAEARDRAAQFLQSNAPSASRRLCFNTGAGSRWQEKRWKTRHYRELGRLIWARDPLAAIVLAGGPDEAEFNGALLASEAGFIDGTSHSIDAFAALVASSDWMLTADSLGYHVACAVATPALCLAGPTSPWELDLYQTNHVLYADLPCTACYLARCPLERTCMDQLTPHAVLAHMSPGRGVSVPPGVVPISVDADASAPHRGAAA